MGPLLVVVLWVLCGDTTEAAIEEDLRSPTSSCFIFSLFGNEVGDLLLLSGISDVSPYLS